MAYEDDPETQARLMRLGLDELLDRAAAHWKANRFDEAEALYLIWHRLDPQNPICRFALAELALLRGDLARGFELWESRTELPGGGVTGFMKKID